MNATVIDTLRYANRLKNAGVEAGQAEAMSRALNHELIEGLATKADLDNAVLEASSRPSTRRSTACAARTATSSSCSR